VKKVDRTNEDVPDREESGPVGWVNWRASRREGVPQHGWVEDGLYTDAWLIGEPEQLGPYKFFNAISHAESRRPLSLNLVLRSHIHLDQALPNVNPHKTRKESWTALAHSEQLAALVSLALGVRCRSGGRLREFWDDHPDPRGQPTMLGHRAPILPEPGPLGPVLPHLGGAGSRWEDQRTKSVNLRDLPDLLDRYPDLELLDAVTLLRAARQYQLAVWSADDDPETSWLRLVSACETAAARAYRTDTDAVEALAVGLPEVHDALAAGEPEALRFVAEKLLPITGATKKFVRFIDEFRPDPPSLRPQAEWQLDWTKLRRAATTIYTARSNALHAGEPFPAALIRPPVQPDTEGPPSEVPLTGITVGTSAWHKRETPMTLATFEYVVRGCLQNWWRSLAEHS
jgi:hypothetical protein